MYMGHILEVHALYHYAGVFQSSFWRLTNFLWELVALGWTLLADCSVMWHCCLFEGAMGRKQLPNMVEKEESGAHWSKTSSWSLLRALSPHVKWVHPRKPRNEEQHKEGLFPSSFPSNMYIIFFTKWGLHSYFPLFFIKMILLLTLFADVVIVFSVSHWLHGWLLTIADHCDLVTRASLF